MDVVVSLAKRRGFVFPSSEIYGGMGGFWDYGPLGVELKNNLKAAWWRSMVQLRDDIFGLDAAIVMNPRVWEVSGHVAGFSDPMVDCRNCKLRFRAEDLKGPPGEIACPNCGQRGTLTEPRKFNLMFETHVGPVEDTASVAYLRPETAQGIFVNFDNVATATRRKLPFGIAQVGKSFRNEITPGNFIFRDREFEQMEMEFFVHPRDEDKWFAYGVAVLPLLRNRPELVEIARRLAGDLRAALPAMYDDTASIGKLYRRQDEIGTPFCVTVDVDSLTDGAATIRERDSMTQERVALAQ